MTNTITITSRRNDTTKGIDREFRVSLPAPPPGIEFTGDRSHTTPTVPTIRYPAKRPHIHGFAKAAVVDGKLNDIAAAIIAARSRMAVAVTVAIEVQG